MPYFDGLHRFLPALVRREGYEIAYVDVIDRPRHSGVSNYGFFDRLWIGIMDLAGVWWLIRRKKPTPVATEVTLMIIQYGQALGNYLYDVFVAKFDFWLAFGLIAQMLFTARFLVQWISERARRTKRGADGVLVLLDGRRLDDAGLRRRQARAGHYPRPGAGYGHLYPQHHADREESREGVEDAGSLIATARAPGHNDNRVR